MQFQDEFTDVPVITQMKQLNGNVEDMKMTTQAVGSTKPYGESQYVKSTRYPLSTSTNKDRKLKKAKRQNRKRGRRS